MKSIKIITSVFILSSLLFVACTSSKNVTSVRNIKMRNIDFSKLEYSIEGNDTIPVSGKLAKNAIIDGFPCADNYIWFDRNWKVTEFQLSEEYMLLGNKIPKKTWVRFYKDKIICMFPYDTEIQSHTCGGSSWGREGIHTVFYLDGKLKHFFPKENVKIDGIFCKSSVFAGVSLYENGRLKKCKLAKDQNINGKNYEEKSTLTFDEEGNVIKTE